MEMLARSPALITNTEPLPLTPFEAVAVTVATPSETPVARPVTGSMVAIPGLALVQVKVVDDGFPSASTALAVTVKGDPMTTNELRTVTTAAGPPLLGPPGVPLLGPDP